MFGVTLTWTDELNFILQALWQLLWIIPSHTSPSQKALPNPLGLKKMSIDSLKSQARIGLSELLTQVDILHWHPVSVWYPFLAMMLWTITLISRCREKCQWYCCFTTCYILMYLWAVHTRSAVRKEFLLLWISYCNRFEWVAHCY